MPLLTTILKILDMSQIGRIKTIGIPQAISTILYILVTMMWMWAMVISHLGGWQ